MVGSRERRKRAGKERAAVKQLLCLIDHAFEGADEECLLANLRPVGEADFAVVPPSGSRSIRQIVGHIGACKYMYANYAFEDRSMTWEDPVGDLGVSIEDLQSRQLDPEPPMAAVIEAAREGTLQAEECFRLIGRLWTLERLFYYIYGGWGQGLGDW